MTIIYLINFAKSKRFFNLIFLFVVIFSLVAGICNFRQIVKIASADTETVEEDDDYALYENYKKFLNYEKRSNYRLYLKYKDKYAFDSTKERLATKSAYDKYQKYQDNPGKYKQYAKFKKEHDKYTNYSEKYLPYKKYKKYKAYDKKKYGRKIYSNYGTNRHKAGYERYVAKVGGTTEANLGGTNLGPNIKIGLWSYSSSSLADDPFKISANKDYKIIDKDGDSLGTVNKADSTRVSRSNGKFKIYDSINEKLVDDEVAFVAADGNNDDLIFDVNKPSSSFDHYRGKISLRESDDSSSEIWVIETVPMEQYIWGMGEITGTGPSDYNRVMTVAYRTYGYWKIKYSTKYAAQGFKVNATPGNQLYYGYDWETAHQTIKDAAQETRGNIVMYKDRIAITPYSSWTDGRTRSWEERWGSDNYPWCQSVKDSYGKHPSMTTKQLEAAGNHMVGMSAHGALHLADEHDWSWQKILKYYYHDIDLKTVY